jgi:ATP-dependent Lhr-like helicase
MTDTISSSFNLLDERIQRFIWAEGWESLRPAQEAAFPLIINADRDVIIAAATAAGKTEAAFLPALTHFLKQKDPGIIVYISPLKALINDQFSRLDILCEQLGIPVYPWHGDISDSSKKRFLTIRNGVVLITPESLEALLCNRGMAIGKTFQHSQYFIIDELHSFIGSERGKQLQSLLHRIDQVVGRKIPRIGLSATLGDMHLAAQFLQPDNSAEVEIVNSSTSDQNIMILVKGFEAPIKVIRETSDTKEKQEWDEEDAGTSAPVKIAAHMFKVLRGSNNLVFPNSRREVERYTNLLNKMCQEKQVPNEFWPHHGSLSKEIRTETEKALKQKERPATAICTNTLELGIDIGAVKSVVQISPPHSVASVRQRLGRSGRRKGEPAILRCYCLESALQPNSSLGSQLRLATVQMAAMILLLLESWYEPPVSHGIHLSTLVQQILSYIAQHGGATIGQLYHLMCARDAPFSGLAKDEFVTLIRHLGKEELLVQESSGALLHGRIGERYVSHYSFYAAFSSDEEYQLVTGGRTIGTLPVSMMLAIGQRILFAGMTWRVDEIREDKKTIFVTHTSGGSPPLFSGGVGRLHTRVRQKMREVLQNDETYPFLDDVAKRFLEEARQAYASLKLSHEIAIDQGDSVTILTWMGDTTNEALACLLRLRRFNVTVAGPGLEVLKGSHTTTSILQALKQVGSEEPPSIDELLKDVSALQKEKWDWALPDTLLRKAYASLYLNTDEAMEWARKI